MFTPCGPSAVPTGGAGVACPPGICTLISATSCFAIVLLPLTPPACDHCCCHRPPAHPSCEAALLHRAGSRPAPPDPSKPRPRYTLSTCQCSSSTSVERPKISIITLIFPLCSSRESTVPSKLSNGPSFTFTTSPTETLNLTTGLGAASSLPSSG